MSSAVFSTSAASSRPFIFNAESHAEACPFIDTKKHGSADFNIAQIVQSAINNQKSTIPVTPASQLGIRPAPAMAPSGIPALDALTGGLPRGCLTEICGPASSGRTTILLAALAAATRRGEYCAVIDASDTLDPHSAAASGIDLDRLLWVRCNENSPQRNHHPDKTECPTSGRFGQKWGFSRQTTLNSENTGISPKHASERRLEQVLRATDLLLESGGFGLLILDLADIPPQSARRIPLTTWFRFRRAVEHKPTVLLAIEQYPIAGSCSSLLLQLGMPSALEDTHALKGRKTNWMTEEFTDFPHPAHAHLLNELRIHAELIRSRLERKPTTSVMFESKTAWAG